MRQRTNDVALQQRLSEASGGKKFRLNEDDPLGREMMGGMHVHRQVLFDDGTMWLVRILRETYTSFDDKLSNQILLSECATLEWLENIDIPTPRLHDYGLRGDPNNLVGVGYMIIDELAGQPFNGHYATES